ncbi:phosphoglucomutase cytoplasmic [Phtheirospermum japonicum]|uniref:phosphoglucomutase (alpha-D-glucose-1,6-bisphosphate-dependent) n=1 Tax=Phtheirospermum japonicum TaxID=374723 RepID=A0A830BBW5_9LAMI|nr:phosphoglucomutase cytoplasmic [Phtheirospermum japonicum]
MVVFKVARVETTPFDGQKPGTSGLRKKVKVFKQPHYLENFVQATLNALGADKVRGATLVVSGDGRYYSKDAIQIIIKMAAANGVRRIWVGQNGLLSTPAVSAVIRERVGADGSKANGSFILTASHNPGGPNEDFGIKYNMENGGPAPEGITDKIYSNTTTIKEYLIAEGLPDVDISIIGVTTFSGPEGQFDVDVFDSANDYVKLMKSIFDFQSIQKLIASPKFSFCYDALHGVAGAYAKRIFVEELAANAVQAIPYFSGGLKGVARSMPTSAALDVVAKNLNLKFFEVPTGWKFFGNLMDAGMCSVCGEESFGTGKDMHFYCSDHIREKDGIWAVLAWLSILAYKNKDNLGGDKLVSVEDIVRQHWSTYGRHYYTRYDYENVDAGIIKGIRPDVAKVVNADEFEYKDPVDGSISKHQGIRYLFEDGSRLVEVALKLSKMQEYTGRSAPTVIT